MRSRARGLVLAVSSAAVWAHALAQAPSRAAWMPQARWGVMTHYLPDWIEPGRRWTSEEWNQLVDGFDVDALAGQLASVGAGYYLISIGQNSGFYLAPNATYDRLVGMTPSRCSRRDLVADLHAALAPRGIRLLVYLPSGAPNQDEAAQKALEWTNGPHPNHAFRSKWEAVVSDWSRRWGTKVDGWWFDGCYWPNQMYRGGAPNFATLAEAARAGNPRAAVAFNPGVYYPVAPMSDQQDFLAGEVSDLEQPLIKSNRVRDGLMDGVQLHMLSYLGQTWGRGAPRLTPARIVAVTRDFLQHQGAVTWDVPVQRNGVIAEPFVQQLRALKRGVEDPSLSPEAAAAEAPVVHRAAWLREARWGVMAHFLADWIWDREAKERSLTAEEQARMRTSEDWNRRVDAFDVEGLARQLEAVGAPYLFITVGQSSGYYLAPNPTYDEITGTRPSHCSRRDLVSDLSAALEKRGIRLLVYSPGGPPTQDAAASRAFGDFRFGPYRNAEASAGWERVLRDWSRRWGRKVAGFWVDGCHWPNIRLRGAPPNFASLAAALRAGNPEAIVGFNAGLTLPVVSVTPHEDFTAGVTADPAALLHSNQRVAEGMVDGAQFHIVAYLGRTWGAGPPRASSEDVVGWTKQINAQGGVVTWDVPLEPTGLVSEPFLAQLRALREVKASAKR
jgi:hypothetical protein